MSSSTRKRIGSPTAGRGRLLRKRVRTAEIIDSPEASPEPEGEPLFSGDGADSDLTDLGSRNGQESDDDDDFVVPDDPVDTAALIEYHAEHTELPTTPGRVLAAYATADTEGSQSAANAVSNLPDAASTETQTMIEDNAAASQVDGPMRLTVPLDTEATKEHASVGQAIAPLNAATTGHSGQVAVRAGPVSVVQTIDLGARIENGGATRLASAFVPGSQSPTSLGVVGAHAPQQAIPGPQAAPFAVLATQAAPFSAGQTPLQAPLVDTTQQQAMSPALFQALEHANLLGLTGDRLLYCSPALINRLGRAHMHRLPAFNVHPLKELPKTVTWGPDAPYGTFAGTLCDGTNKKAIVLHFVGEISKLELQGLNGDAQARASITVLPFDAGARPAAELQVAKHSTPADLGAEQVVYWGPGNQIRATTWTSGYGQPPTQFTRIYDATDRLQAKSDMTTLPASILRLRDIVMVEARIKRYKIRTGDGARTQGAGGWSTWAAYYDLVAINLFQRVPSNVPAFKDVNVVEDTGAVDI